MSERQRDTAFLTQLISYDDTDTRHDLAAKIERLQRDERCVRRAAWLMVLFASLSAAGICYAAVFVYHPANPTQFLIRPLIKFLITVGLGSVISLVTFVVLGWFYRWQLARHREECRCLALKLVESRLGQPLRLIPEVAPVCDGAAAQG